MKKTVKSPGASPIAIISPAAFAILALLFQFLRLTVNDGGLVAAWQLPLGFGTDASAMNLIEAALVFANAAALALGCVMVTVHMFRDADAAMADDVKQGIRRKLGNWRRFLLIPIILSFISIMEEAIYIYLYEGFWSFDHAWFELLTTAVMAVLFSLTAWVKIKTPWPFAGLCVLLSLFELCRLIFPAMPFVNVAYVSGANVYVSAFIAAVSYYLAYLAVGLMMENRIRGSSC